MSYRSSGSCRRQTSFPPLFEFRSYFGYRQCRTGQYSACIVTKSGMSCWVDLSPCWPIGNILHKLSCTIAVTKHPSLTVDQASASLPGCGSVGPQEAQEVHGDDFPTLVEMCNGSNTLDIFCSTLCIPAGVSTVRCCARAVIVVLHEARQRCAELYIQLFLPLWACRPPVSEVKTLSAPVRTPQRLVSMLAQALWCAPHPDCSFFCCLLTQLFLSPTVYMEVCVCF